jgi:hypothetical protein
MNASPPPRRDWERQSPLRVLRAMTLCARGRVEGIALFGDTIASFLTSLAPLIAFPLVATLLQISAHPGSPEALSAAVTFLQALDALLVLPVISHALARRWGREEQWLRYATAANWCHWLLEGSFVLAFFAVAVLAGLGMPAGALLKPFLLAAMAYSLWLQFFLVRRGLGVAGGRAVLLVIAGNVVAGMLIAGPALLRGNDALA